MLRFWNEEKNYYDETEEVGPEIWSVATSQFVSKSERRVGKIERVSFSFDRVTIYVEPTFR